MTQVIQTGQTVKVIVDEGESAYEIAVENGYVGTEQQWLASLNGTTSLVAPVKYALTYPIAGGARSGLPIADGRQTVDGDSVFDFLSTDAQNRGIWIVHAGSWTRRGDFDTPNKINGSSVFVQDGDTLWAKQWRVANTIVNVSVDPIEFVSWEGFDTSNNMRRKYGVLVDGIDSNTGSYNGTQNGWDRERGSPLGPLAHWNRYMMAVDGMKVAALVASIATGDRNAAAVHYVVATPPNFDGNIWRVINANADWWNMRGLTNDLGLYPRTYGSGGTREAVRANLRALVAFCKTVRPHMHLELDMPQPFEKDFTVGPTNVTQFATADPSDPTVAGGSAFLNRIMYEELMAWDGRLPGVTVFNASVLSSATDFRCDDKAVNWLDREPDGTGAYGPMINNGLHATDLCERRREQEKLRRHCAPQRSFLSDYLKSPNGEADSALEEHWMYFEQSTYTPTVTTLSVRTSPEYLFWLNSRFGVMTTSGRTPAHEAMRQAEASMFMKGRGALQRIVNMRGDITLFFPGSGNTYHASSARISTTVTDASGELYYTVQFDGINAAAEYAAAGSGATPWLQRVRVSADRRSALPFLSKDVRGTMPPGTAAVASLSFPNPFFQPVGANASQSWPIRRVQATRYAATDGAMTIDVGLSNQAADRRLVDIAATSTASIAGTALTVASGTGLVAGQTVTGTGVTAGTTLVSGAGTSWVVTPSQTVASTSMEFGPVRTASTQYIIGQLSFSASALSATYTPNQANIDFAVAQAVGWFPAIGNALGYAVMKGAYRIMFVPSIAITLPISVLASETL